MKAKFNKPDNLLALLNTQEAVGDHADYYIRELSKADHSALDAGLSGPGYVWADVDGTLAPISDPSPVVPVSVEAWRIRAVAKVTPHGNDMLIDAIQTAVAGIADPATKAGAEEVFFGGNILRRHSSLLNQLASDLGLDQDALDSLFVSAAAIDL